jgi:hypothetical protein
MKNCVIQITPVFGLGGCATLGNEYARVIHQPWRRMKEIHFGGADVQLHGAGPRLPEPQVGALAAFFRTSDFHRLAVVVTDKTALRSDYPPYAVVADALMRRVVPLGFPAGRQTAGSIVLVFEASQRGNPLAKRHIQPAAESALDDFLKNAGPLRAWRLPLLVRAGFLPKAAGAPGLEVADFIINSAGRQAQKSTDQWSTDPLKDFGVMFHEAAAEGGLSHFMRIDSVG